MGKTGNNDLYPIVPPQNDDFVHGYRKESEENVSFLVEDFLNPDGSTQDNKHALIRTQLAIGDYDPHTIINTTDFSESTALTYFTVNDVQIPIFAIPVREQDATTSKLRTDYYLVLNYGKGNYGVGGDITLTEDDLFYLRTGGLVTIPIDPNGDPSVIYTFNVSDLTAPHTAINAGGEVGGYPITSDGDYYVELIDTDRNGGRAIWKFTGDASADPVYGVDGDGSVASFSDFTLFDLSDPQGDATENKILVNKTVVGAVIDGTGVPNDDIHLAVNRSFRGAVSITENEVRIFEVNRNVYANDFSTYSVWLEKYMYTKGKNTINSDSVREDFELIYERKLTDDITTGSQGAAPNVIALGWNDVNDPAGAVNASTDTYVIDGTRDWVFMIFDNTDATIDNYKIYAFSTDAADYGTYGNSAATDTATNPQFTELTQSGTGGGGSYFEEFSPAGDPTSYISPRLRIKPEFGLNGFWIDRNANKRVGVDVSNPNTGNVAAATFVASIDSTPFGRAFQIGVFGINYFVAALREKAHLFSRTGMASVLMNHQKWEVYSHPSDGSSEYQAITRRTYFDPVDDTWHVNATTEEIAANADGKTLVHKDYVDFATPRISETADTGDNISLSNDHGRLCNMASPNANTTYTYNSEVAGGWAVVLVNASSEPVITGAEKIAGDPFIENTNMYMKVTYNGDRAEYWFEDIITQARPRAIRIPFSLSEAELDIISGTPHVLKTAVGAGYDIVPIRWFYKITAGSTQYDFGAGGIYLEYSGNPGALMTVLQADINSSSDVKKIMNAGDFETTSNADLVITAAANPTVGDGTFEGYVDVLVYNAAVIS